MPKGESKRITELKHHARRLSIKEGLFGRAKDSLGFNYISPFAIAINSSNAVVAMLSAVHGLLGPLSQMIGSRIFEKTSRKKILMKTIFWESLMWLPLVLIAFLFYMGIISKALPVLLLVFFAFYVFAGNLGYPAWFSWMGDIVDEGYRGRWFAKRNLLLGSVTIVLTISAAFFLDYFKKNHNVMFGFIILFSLAFLSRMISVGIFKKQYEPKTKIKKKDYFSFSEFISKIGENNFGIFTVFRALISFATFIASALIAVYLLRILNFDYVTYMIILLSGVLFQILSFEIWGKFADVYGNYKVITITSFFIPVLPLLWIFKSSPLYLVFVPSLIGGIVWAGFNLSVANYIYDNVQASRRSFAVSYSNVLYGVGVFLGSGLGAILIKYANVSFIEPLFAIFIISAILRAVVVFVFIRKLREVRKIKRFSGKGFKKMLFKDGPTTISEEFHQIRSLPSYLFER
ncbi:MAG: MFS transporter [Nanoarchaeota archaeon]|nr:MFS transporter [Nanoarchaeota archaeon]